MIDGKVVADVAEERFTRTKHYCALPIRSVEYCLKSQKMGMADIDAVAVPALCGVPDLDFLLELKGARREKRTGPRRALDFVRGIMNKPDARPPIYFKSFPLARRTEIIHVEHHLTHAA